MLDSLLFFSIQNLSESFDNDTLTIAAATMCFIRS